MIIVAGRPSMGKTAFSLTLGKNIVKKHNIPLIIFSLEMSVNKFIGFWHQFIENKFQSIKIWKNDINRMEKVSESMKTISNLPIFIDDILIFKLLIFVVD